MKKSLPLFLISVGLVLAAVDPAFSQADNLHLRSGMATRTFNNLTGPASFLIGSVDSSYPASAANDKGRDTTTTLNTMLAVLAGGLTLVLLQRRNHNDPILRPRH